MKTSLFGLDVLLPGPVAGCPPRPWSGRRPPVEVVMADAGGLAAAWDQDGAEPVVREPDQGRALLTVDQSGGAYRVAWRHIGDFVLSADGTVLCTREPGGEEHWERYLLAQILPLAAVMGGVEVLHASAVVVDGRAIGIVGPSGAGKSTVAQALVATGAELLTDDVLGLTHEGARPTAHPGPDQVRIGLRQDKEVASLPAASSPAPLHTLFFLDRDADRQALGGAVGFRQLAGATFNLLVRSPERLERHLDLAAALAGDRVPVSAAFPPDATPDQIATALLDWSRSNA